MVRVLIQAEAGSQDRRVYDERTLIHQGMCRIALPYPYPYGSGHW